MNASTYNSVLDSISHKSLHVMEGFIDCLKGRYSIHLNFHDLVGVSSINQDFERIFSPYLYHNNLFCNFVKRNGKCLQQCVLNKEKLCLKCGNLSTPFYGRCHMGIEEFVFPVRCEGRLIAVICAGQFFSRKEKALELLEKKASEYGLDSLQCKMRYLETVHSVNFSLNDFYFDMALLCEYIALNYKESILEMNGGSPVRSNADKTADKYKDHFIVSNTIHFVKQNYSMDLSLDLLASYSFCNPSYLSYIFKKKTKVNIVDYISRIRIEAAKELLDITTRSVTDIAAMVGFNDSSYFARVFKRHTGISPRRFRERKG